MTIKPEDLRLADILVNDYLSLEDYDATAAELRRLHEVNRELLEALLELDANPEYTSSWLKARAAIALAIGGEV